MTTTKIKDGDIKLLQSKVMDDVPEGGGGPTGREVQWGKSNQVFEDVTEVARAGGQVSIRQLHAAVQTGDVQPLLDANIIVDQPSSDPNICITIAACAPFATRTEIAQAIANYLIPGTEWSGVLLGNHVVNQRNIQIFHRPGTPAPSIGRTLLLVEREGQANEKLQYVRITSVETVTRTFTYQSGGAMVDFEGAVSTCGISDRLNTPFTGSEPSRSFGRDANAARLRDTTVADAVQFYGAVPTTAPYTLGDATRQIKVAGIYTQLVPSSRTESAKVDQRPAAMRSITLATGPREVTVAVSPHTRRLRVGQENRGYSWTGMMRPFPSPGTVIFSFMVLGTWYTCRDNGAGELEGDAAGTVNYANGSWALSLPALPDVDSAILIQWGESTGFVNRSAAQVNVRPPEYVLKLQHAGIKPGSLSVAWESAGQPKLATDSAGFLQGHASGEVNHAAGELLIRPALGAWMDAQGQFVISYQHATVVTKNVAASVDAAGFASITLDTVPAPGSVAIKWVTVRSVTASSGATSGGASEGTRIRPTSEDKSSYVRNSTRSSKTQDIVTHTLTDDGSGGLGERGSVDYASKTLLVKLVDLDSTTENYQSEHEQSAAFELGMVRAMGSGGASTAAGGNAIKGGDTSTTAVSEQVLAASTLQITYAEGFASVLSASETLQPEALTIELCPTTTQYVVPGSVQFTWMGHTYIDVDGDIIRDRSASAPGTLAGRMDYEAGVAYLSDYGTTSPTAAFALQSLWTTRKPWTTGSLFFRTDSAPVAVNGLTLNVADAQGNAITMTADLDGLFTGAQCRGHMDYQTGVVELQFGAFVDDAALTPADKAEWWYDAAEVGSVQEGKIWKPHPVDPTTLRFNSVTYVYLPLDADIIGMDPVRLPADGRVPIFRTGYYVVVGHTAALPKATLSNGQILNCGRARLSRAWIVDANGDKVQAGWSVDLDAGLISIADVNGWAQPVQVHHRIEEMARAADVQINGTLTLTKALSHHFPAGSVVSSALYVGTLRARVSHLFDQAQWDGVAWADNVSGNGAPAQFNDTTFPVVVTNAGALSERWLLRFKNTTEVEVIGENVGNLGTFPIASDIAPINPNTRTDTQAGVPYFTLKAGGWGAGWAVGNGLRINTVGAMQPFACIRTVQPSEAAGTDYQSGLTVRGDIDRQPA